MEFSFERLLIWQKSRSIVKEVYKIASMFPPFMKNMACLTKFGVQLYLYRQISHRIPVVFP